MKRKAVLAVMCALIMTGCAGAKEAVSEDMVDARYTPGYTGIETTYEYEYDFWGKGGFKLVPNTHTVVVQDLYEGMYKTTYSDGKTDTNWKEISKEEYEDFVESRKREK